METCSGVFMARFVSALFLLLLLVPKAQAAPRPGELPYYGQDFFAARPSDAALKTALFQILSLPHHRTAGDFDRISPQCQAPGCAAHFAIGYSKAREFLMGDFYLVRGAGGFGVKDVYCERVAEAAEFRGVKPAPHVVPDATVVNTEHTWPQSKFVRQFPQDLQKSDLHHLFPTDSEVNADRSSYDFGNVKANAKALKCAAAKLGLPAAGSRTVFEPPLSHKGNVARALFYFSVRYQAPLEPAQEAALREWHQLDPVDAEEKSRNDRIHQLQRNRNPFVDYPELVGRIRDF